MTRKQRKSQDKAAGAIPEKDGVRGEGKGRSEGGGKRKRHGGDGVISDPEMVEKSDPERELIGEAEISEKMKKKKKKKKKEKSGEEVSKKEGGGDDGKGKMEGNKDGEVSKGGNKSVERREDGEGAEGKLEDGVNKKKKRKRGGTEDEKAEREKKEDSEKGGDGVKIKGSEDTTKKDESAKKLKEHRGSKNGDEDRSKAIALNSEGRKVEEDEVRKSSKKQRERKDKDVEKDEGDADDLEKKPWEESGLSRKQKQRNGDENSDEKLKNGRKSNGTVSQPYPPLVLSLSRSMQKSRRDSPNKKNKEKVDGNGKKPSEPKSQSKKGKSSEGEIKDVTVPTSSTEEELEEGANKAEKGKRDGSSGFKKKRTSGEKADEKDPKSCRLPLNRVRTITRRYISISKVSQESYFLICKATECFINQFCEDAFELAASHGLSKVLKYEHLSSLVYNMDRYDFLSDYIPQKKKTKDALALAEAKASESR